MKNKKSSLALPLGIAFVGFTTQFGGGFASGTQIYQYFINCGIWGLLTPILAQAILSIVYFYGMKVAFENKTYDYRSFSDKFYGKYKGIFSNLYELSYIVMLCLAPAVAFATGGSVLNALTGMPYLLCTLIIGIFIFIIILFGTNLVRKSSSVISILIIAGLLITLIPNIVSQWDVILKSIHKMISGSVPVGSKFNGSFFSSLLRGMLYGIFQVTSVGMMYQHVESLNSEKEISKAMKAMYIVDVLVMYLAIFGLLAVSFDKNLVNYDVPMLLLVKNGVGAKFLSPIISILILLGAVSTGVNMISGMVNRILKGLKNKKGTNKKGSFLQNFFVSLIFTVLAWLIAQLGLIPLVSKGYSYIGYGTLFIIVIPFIIHGIKHRGKKARD